MPMINPFGPEQRVIVRYKGIFDLDAIYGAVRKWYDERKYEFQEYLSKAHEPGHSELELFWQGYRNDTEFLRVWIDVYAHIWDMDQVDVIKDGVKKKMVRARIEVHFSTNIEYDYEHKFESSKFFEELREFYFKYVYFKKFGVYGDKIEYELQGFAELFKQLLNMDIKGNQFADAW